VPTTGWITSAGIRLESAFRIAENSVNLRRTEVGTKKTMLNKCLLSKDLKMIGKESEIISKNNSP